MWIKARIKRLGVRFLILVLFLITLLISSRSLPLELVTKKHFSRTYVSQTDELTRLINTEKQNSRPSSEQNYQVEDSVEVLWEGTWWPATVFEIRGSTYCITYDGFDRSWDECIGTDRIRPIIQSAETQANRLYRVGFNYLINQQYIQAIENLEQSLEISESESLDNAVIQERVLNALSNAYAILGDYEKLQFYAEKHLAIANQLSDSSAATIALVRLSSVYFDRGEYAESESRLREAIARSQGLSPATRGFALSALGKTYLAQGKTQEAIALFEEALNTGDPEVRQTTLEGLGLAYVVAEDYDRAIEILEESRTIAQQLQGLFDVSIQANALNNLGYAFLQAGDLQKAEDALREAVGLWESQRARLGSNDPFRISVFELQALTYGTLQKVLISRGMPEAALEVAEQGRTRALIELIAQRDTSQAIEGIDKVPTIEEIRQIARTQDAVLVEYSLADTSPRFATPGRTVQSTELFVWVIQPTGEITSHQINLEPLWRKYASLEDLVVSTRQSILRQLVRDENDSSSQLQELYELLIQQIDGLLTTSQSSPIIFIPHRELFFVPFPALLDRDGKYLIEKHTILTAPSISVLGLIHESRRQNLEDLSQSLVVGNTSSFAPEEELAPLDFAGEEARAVAAVLNTTAILDSQATKEFVLEQIPNAPIIHLATHGEFDDTQGLNSWIALAPSERDNGLLTAAEILELRLNAELVVLSACTTGRGRITGDGIIGLSRSLIAAGASNLIVSLWSVRDETTAFLMEEFYNNFQNGKAQALRQAMLETLKKHPNKPVTWAAFTLIGGVE
jgi:CHAT domain-containing protein/predicted negative regulator of RcsB-dependent stress response